MLNFFNKIDWATFLIFLITVSISPGPNTIACAAHGLHYGFRRTLPFLAGIFFGFFLIMLGISNLSSRIIQLIPDLHNYLRIIGGVYIVWLAFRVLIKGFRADEQKPIPLNFFSGFLMQFFNPKVAFLGLTIFSIYLFVLETNYILLLLASFLLSLWILFVDCLWAALGSLLFHYFNQPLFRKAFSFICALMLFFLAFDTFGFFEFLERLGWL